MNTKLEEWFSLTSTDDPLGAVDQAAVEVRRRQGVKLGAFTVVAKGQCVALVQLNYGEDAYGGFPWSLPGGGVNHDELPVDAAVRELREETSLEVPRQALRVAAALHRPYVADSDGHRVGEVTLLYCCDIEDEAELTVNSREIREARFVEFDLERWLTVPATGAGAPLQPLRRHWIYWSQLGMRRLRESKAGVTLWTYREGRDLALPIL